MMKSFLLFAMCFWGSFFAVAADSAPRTLELFFAPDAWRFANGPEFPGAAGKLSFSASGVGKLEGDFSGGGDYVQAQLIDKIKFPTARELCVEVKTSAAAVSLRYQDGSGQFHQRAVKLSGDGSKWQRVVFPLQASGLAWGGAGDKRFHDPLTSFGLILRVTSLLEKRGDVEFRNLALVDVPPDATVPVRYRIAKPETLFRTPGEPGELEIELTAGAVDFDASLLRFEFHDYAGRAAGSGVARFDPVSRKLALPPPSATGYYDLMLPGLGIQAAVVVGRAAHGVPDPYFGMDTSLSRKNHIDGGTLRSLLRILKWNGIGQGRDRFTWGEIEPKRNQQNFLARDGRYELFRSIAREEGITILDVFHDTPDWNKRLNSDRDNFIYNMDDAEGYTYGSNVYPRNLVDASAGLAAIVRRWPAIGALEVWNEPDIDFGNRFPGEYVIAFTKAVSTRFQLENLPATVVGGVFADTRETTAYYRNMIAGGLLDDIDALSFHSYRKTAEHELQIERMRQIERDCGTSRFGIPYWITESGMPWPRGTARPGVDDDRRSASEIVGKAIEFRALGIERYFTFCYPYYDENKNNFAMMDAHHAPMRSMAAYGYCAKLLAHKVYVGDLAIPEAARSRVFAGKEGIVACLYRPMDSAPRDVSLALPENLAVTKITGPDGRELALRDGRLPLDDGIAYLHLSEMPPEALLKRDTRAMKLYRLAGSYQARPRAAKPVVIQPDGDLAEIAYDCHGYALEAGKPFEYKGFWNNLSREAVTVEPDLALPPGIRVEGFSAGIIEIPPGERREFRFRLIADETLPQREYSTLRLGDRRGNATAMVISCRQLKRLQVASGEKIRLGQECWRAWRNGPERSDIQAEVSVNHTPEILQLEVNVKDSAQFCNFPASQAWRGDSIQFALQMPKGKAYEYSAARSGDGDRVYCHAPKSKAGVVPGIPFEFRRTEDGSTVYRLKVPPSALGVERFEPGTTLGFSLVVNSGGPNGRNGYLAWGEGIADEKNPRRFNRLLLK